jgi:hypothetical protein
MHTINPGSDGQAAIFRDSRENTEKRGASGNSTGPRDLPTGDPR